jgi:hypothetical protein
MTRLEVTPQCSPTTAAVKPSFSHHSHNGYMLIPTLTLCSVVTNWQAERVTTAAEKKNREFKTSVFGKML